MVTRAMRAGAALLLFLSFSLTSSVNAAVLEDFGVEGPFDVGSLALTVPSRGAGEETGELFLDYPIDAGSPAPLVVFALPIHGFTFALWRRLLAPVIRTLVTNGFAVAQPSAFGSSAAREFSGGLFPGTTSSNGMDLREIVTRYLNFMTHASRHLNELVESDIAFEASGILSTERVGVVGFSVGGAIAQYLAQVLDASVIPGRVSAVVALAPTSGSDVPFTGSDIGAELFQEFFTDRARFSPIPTFYIAGERDGMGGLRDAGYYFDRSTAPRVLVTAGNGATHCHAIVPMSECDVIAGTRGVHLLDAIVAHAAMTAYLLPELPYWREKRELARDILWGEGLRTLADGVLPSTPVGERWAIADVLREPGISLELSDFSIVAPLDPEAVEVYAVTTSTLRDVAPECEDIELFVVDAPVGIKVETRRMNPYEFSVRLSWTTVPPRARPRAGRSRRQLLFRDVNFDELRDMLGIFRMNPRRLGRAAAATGTRRSTAPRRDVIIGARHACARSGFAFATVRVSLPYR